MLDLDQDLTSSFNPRSEMIRDCTSADSGSIPSKIPLNPTASVIMTACPELTPAEPFDMDNSEQFSDSVAPDHLVKLQRIDETEQTAHGKGDKRLTFFNPSRSFPWSDAEGDKCFYDYLRRWSEAPDGTRHSVSNQIVDEPPKDTSPAWIQDYREAHSLKLSERWCFVGREHVFEAWSPDKILIPARDRNQIEAEEELPDLPESESPLAKQSDPFDENMELGNVDSPLFSHESLLFMHIQYDTELCSTPPSTRASSVTDSSGYIPNFDSDGPSDLAEARNATVAPEQDDANAEEEVFMTPHELEMLRVRALRSVVASTGGLAALPAVFDDEEEEAEENAVDEVRKAPKNDDVKYNAHANEHRDQEDEEAGDEKNDTEEAESDEKKHG